MEVEKTISAHVMNVPRGISLELLIGMVNNEEPVTNSAMVKIITVRQQKNQILFIFFYLIESLL
ncbi:hypothetical protein EMN47_17270 [Prolixibacteraceae bacterium JC049]|nr:hypothetical protein [Prolixibacteraceae bacterium JC049]